MIKSQDEFKEKLIKETAEKINLQKENEQLRKIVDESKEKSMEMIGKLREKFIKSQKELDEKYKKVEEDRNNLIEFKKKFEESQGKLMKKDKEIKNSKEKYDKLYQEKELLSQQIFEIKGDMDKFRKSHKEENEKSLQEIEKLITEKEKLKEEAEKSQKLFESSLKKSERGSDERNAVLLKSQEDQEKLKKKIIGLQNNLVKLEEKIKEITSEKEEIVKKKEMEVNIAKSLMTQKITQHTETLQNLESIKKKYEELKQHSDKLHEGKSSDIIKVKEEIENLTVSKN